MSSISIIGLGGMASALAARALAGGNTVEVIGRDVAKAEDLAAKLGDGATAGTFGTAPTGIVSTGPTGMFSTAPTGMFSTAPTGDIVIRAVPSASAVPIVTQYGNALAGKVIIDITNPVNADATGLVTADGTSAAQEIAKAAPASASVVKAFNTVFGHVLTPGRSVDVLFAGDDVQAKASVSAFIDSLGLRPLDAGGLEMTHWLEGMGLLMISLARHGVGNFNFTLGISALS